VLLGYCYKRGKQDIQEVTMNAGNLFSRRVVIALWLGFFLVKFFLGYLHLRAARRKVALIRRDYRSPQGSLQSPEDSGGLVDEINAFVDGFNSAASRNHLFAALGLFVASLTTLMTLFGDLRSTRFSPPR